MSDFTRTLLLTLSLTLALGALATGCKESVPGCQNDLDCRDGRICVASACVPQNDGDGNNATDDNNSGNNAPNNEANNAPNNEANNEVLDAGPGPEADASEPPIEEEDAPAQEDIPVLNPFPVLELSPESVNFGNVVVDTTEERTVTLRNAGDVAMNVTSVGVSGQGFEARVNAATPFELGPRQEVTVNVSFTPNTVTDEARQGALTVNSDDPEREEATVPLTGQGVNADGPCLTIDPGTLNFGTVAPGNTAARTFEARNCGTVSLDLTGFTVEGADGDEFNAADLEAGALASGESAELELQWTPAAEGELDAALRVTAAAGGETLDAQTNLRGVAADRPTGCALENVATLTLDEPQRFNLCQNGDQFGNLASPPGCTADGERFQGQDRIFELTLDRPTRVRFNMRDDDDMAAIDTVIYVRTACEVAESQILCGDDVPCSESEVEFGCEDPNAVQPRQSRIEADLDAGTYYVIADLYTYRNFVCGTVLLNVETVD